MTPSPPARRALAGLGEPSGPGIVTGVADPRWLRLVRAAPQATPFHDPAWAELLARCYGYRTLVVGVADESGELCAGAPMIEIAHLGRHRWVSLPFSDVCPPLATRDDALPSLVDSLLEHTRRSGVSHVEVRAALPPPAQPMPSTDVIHRLELSRDADVLFDGLAPMRRRNLRTAVRHGVTVRRGEQPGDLTDTFYRLHVATRHHQGVPVQPRRYFRLLWEQLLARDLGFLLLAQVDGAAVAGAVFLTDGRTLTYKYAASAAAARPLCANDLLLWEACRWALDRGYRVIDFGRSDLANVGLRRFKDSWGAREEALVYSTVGQTVARDGRGRLAHLAEPVLRRGPRWLTRAAGELLYRYAG